MDLKGHLFKERQNIFIDSFFAELYKTGTPFSMGRFYANIGKEVRYNPLRLRGIELEGLLDIGCDPDMMAFPGYFLGRIFGLTLIPLDGAITTFNYFKDKTPLNITHQIN